MQWHLAVKMPLHPSSHLVTTNLIDSFRHTNAYHKNVFTEYIATLNPIFAQSKCSVTPLFALMQI